MCVCVCVCVKGGGGYRKCRGCGMSVSQRVRAVHSSVFCKMCAIFW